MIDLPVSLDVWVRDDVLDALYDRACEFWEQDQPELADALVELADALAAVNPPGYSPSPEQDGDTVQGIDLADMPDGTT